MRIRGAVAQGRPGRPAPRRPGRPPGGVVARHDATRSDPRRSTDEQSLGRRPGPRPASPPLSSAWVRVVGSACHRPHARDPVTRLGPVGAGSQGQQKRRPQWRGERVAVLVRLPASVAASLKRHAAVDGDSLSSAAAQLIEAGLAERGR